VTKYYIDISYREDFGKRELGGSFYDHYSVRWAINYPTRIVASPEQNTTALQRIIREAHMALSAAGEVPDETAKIYPQITTNITDIINGGLLFIPGTSRETYDSNPRSYQLRIRFELELIKKAKLYGKPILAICSGAWTLLSSYGGNTGPVTDHDYRGGMPRVTTAAGKVGIVNNKELHKVRVSPGSLLATIVGITNQEFSVNSVHWEAPLEPLPEYLQKTASSIYDPAISPKKAIGTGELMRPQDSIEAFEDTYGAPILGIQWHPETYNSGPSQQVLLFMAQAGTTYHNRRTLVREYKEKISANTGEENISKIFKLRHV
jgi:gamma-glutamyl-gamma-aminobutyrate hydrolase PuuD